MDKYITDERTGLKYEFVGDYYLIAGDDEPEKHHIGIWGQRHLRYLKQNCKTIYAALLTSGKLNDYLADLDEQAEDMFSRLVKELAENEGISEALKTENQMLWVQRKQRGAREGSFSLSDAAPRSAETDLTITRKRVRSLKKRRSCGRIQTYRYPDGKTTSTDQQTKNERRNI